MDKLPYIIAVDFDGTLSLGKWPDIGEPNIELMYYLYVRRMRGDKVILWTCRTGRHLQEAISWCWDYGLAFDAVNENLPEVIEAFGDDGGRKIFANIYIDDLSVKPGELNWVDLMPGIKK